MENKINATQDKSEVKYLLDRKLWPIGEGEHARSWGLCLKANTADVAQIVGKVATGPGG